MIAFVRRRWAFAGILCLWAAPLQSPLIAQANPKTFIHNITNVSVIPAPTIAGELDQQKKNRLATYIAKTYDKPIEYAQHIVHVTFSVAEAYALPPNLLLAMMAKESRFDTTAKSAYGATGLMQVVPRFHLKRLSQGETLQSMHQPQTNIRVGASVLSEYLEKEGTLDKALVKYSGKASGYSARVKAYWQQFEQIAKAHVSSPTNV